MRNNIYKIILFTLLVLVVNISAIKAQIVNNNEFNKITVEDGLSNSVVYKIMQDSDGFLWFLTKDGLNKFDGTNITKYSLAERTYQYAKDNIVLSFEANNKNSFYCATASGRIYSFNKQTDTFEKVNIKGPNPLISPIWDLHLENNNNLIVCSASGLFHVNLSSLKIQYINNISIISQTIFKDNAGNYWLGTDKGLYFGSITMDSTLVKSNLKYIEELGENVIYSINQDKQNRIWIGTRDKGLFIYNTQTKQFKNLNQILLNKYGNIVSIRDINILDDKIILALDGEGICALDYSFNIIQTYQHLNDVASSLNSNGIYDILFDKDSSMWVATFGGGVNILHKNRHGFVKISHEPYNTNSLKNNTARSFLESNDKKLWFGTKKGISILNTKSGKWKHLSLNKKGEDEAIALSICQSADNSIWVGTYNYGLIKINPNNYAFETIERINSNGDKIGSDFLFSVMEDSKGRIWNGGIHGNLSIYNPKTKISKEILINNVKHIYESAWGTIYVGTTAGLFVVNPTTLEFERPKPYNVLLNQNRIYCIYNNPNNNKQLWLGTEGGGLILWDITQQIVKVYSLKDGLPSNFIYGIQEDKSGALWLSTTNGLSKFNPKTLEVTNYDHTDGLSDQEFNFGAHGKTRSGEMFFGGQHGYTYLNPNKLETDSTIPDIVFNSFKLFGKEQTINSENSPLKKHLNTTNKIYLKPKQNSISFTFSAIDFTNQNKVNYSWMLKGFDQNWNDPTTNQEAIYTNLKPGQYTFLVKASSHNRVWGNNIRSIEIEINPPFSKSFWAYLIYTLLLMGIISLIIHYNRIRLKERNALEKTRFFVNIAHDLRTPLTLVKAPIEQLKSSNKIDKNDKGSLLLASKNVDRLNRLVTQLMDFQKADLNKMQFRPAPYMFIEFFKDTSNSFLPLIDDKNINVNYNLPETDFELWFDKNKMEKVIFNLLSNAIKYTVKGGNINLSIEWKNDTCVMHFEDSGIGIPKDQQKSIFTRYFRASNVINSQETGSGVGLMLVKKLVELHGGSVSFNSTEGVGTTFSVKIPSKIYQQNEYATEQSNKTQTIESYASTDEIAVADKDSDANMLKVLLVEDNLELLNYVASIMEKHFNVLKAENGKIGLELAKEKHPDIIISDIMMPVMDGNQMCNLLKSNINTCHIPIILLTALNTLDYKIEGLKVGADAYVEKPFDTNYLVAQVNNLIATRQRLKQKFAFHAESDEAPVLYNEMDTELLDKAKKIIMDNITNNDLSVEMLTKELCMSRPVLYRKIKALTDQSPQDFIRLIRLVEAKKLLLNRAKSITDVAYETGFSDPKYFSTSFKKQFGCTPSQYVKGDKK